MKSFVVIFCVCLARVLLAQNPTWEPVGSLGGDFIRTITTDGKGHIYAYFNDTTFLYETTDNGVHWKTLNLYGVRSITLGRNGISFLVSLSMSKSTGDIYKTIDDGMSWTKIPFPGKFPFQVSKVSDSLLYVFADQIYISKDEGISWTTSHALRGTFTPVAVGPSGEMYLEDQNLVSKDTGKTWQKCSDSVNINYGKQTALYFDSNDPGSSTLQILSDGRCVGLFWNAVSDSHLFCRSTDYGIHWNLIPVFEPHVSHSDTIIGVFFAKDNGLIYAFDEYSGQGFKSTDFGNSWNDYLAVDYEPVALVLDQSDKPIVSTATNLYILDGSEKNWIGKGPSVADVFKIAVDKNGNIIASVAYHNNSILGYIDAEGFYALSTDDGFTWNPLFSSQGPWTGPRKGDRVSDIAIDSANNIIVAPSYGFYSSSDLGKTWFEKLQGNVDGGPITIDWHGNTFVSDGLPSIVSLDSNQFYINQKYLYRGLDPNRSGIFGLMANVNGYLFASALDGVYRLQEGDTVWSKSIIPYSADAIKVLFSNISGKIFLGSSDHGIFTSEDNGLNWSKLNNGLPDSNIFSITGDSHGNIYSSNSKGVFILNPNSTTWKDISKGLDFKDIRSLAWSNKEELFAGTNGKGIYKLSTSTFRKVAPAFPEDNQILVHYKEKKIFIHSSTPFNPIASLYSIDGRLLRRGMLEITSSSNYTFDVSGIHSQFGFLVLQTDKGVIARKVMLSEP